MSVIPLLAASGTIFMDARAHKTIYDGCQVARARGAAVKRFRFEDPDHLDQLLPPSATRPPRVMDGVNSMTGNAPDIRASPRRPRHGALLYVDDAHGFGVIGERPDASPALRLPRQQRHPPRRRHLRRHRPRRRLLEGVLVAPGLHRLPDRRQGPPEGRGPALPVSARRRSPRSPPSSPASTSTSAAATRCARACTRLTRVIDCLDRLGVATPNHSGFPIIEVPLRDHTRIAAVGDSSTPAACTSRSRPFRSCPRTRSGSASRSRRRTPTPRSTRDRGLEGLAELGELRLERRRGRGPRSSGLTMSLRPPRLRAAAPWQALPRGGALLCALYVWVRRSPAAAR